MQRRESGRNKKIRKEDMVNVLSRRNNPNHFDDETIPGKAIVLKMPERSMRTYFIPLPVDLDVCSLFMWLTMLGVETTSCGAVWIE